MWRCGQAVVFVGMWWGEGRGREDRGEATACVLARSLACLLFLSEAVRGSGNACLAAGTASKCGWMGGHSTAPVPKEATLAAGPPRMRPAGAVRGGARQWERLPGGWDGQQMRLDGRPQHRTCAQGGDAGGGAPSDAAGWGSEAVRGSGNACLAAGTASKCGWMGGHSTAPVPKEATLAAGPPRMRPAGAVRGGARQWERLPGGWDGQQMRLDGRPQHRTCAQGGDAGGGAPSDAAGWGSEAVRGSGNACLAAGTASKCGWMGGHSTAPVPKEATLAAGPPRMRPAGAVRGGARQWERLPGGWDGQQMRLDGRPQHRTCAQGGDAGGGAPSDAAGWGC
ncbi:uncharacterized PE-PGRS family protein PE_PGRS20-like, partial [Schistocerca nitens]|uniref:uncharacterized PE-PGRS family protein PE_PGRS20-like n=1 Tax=Schistocerca nitens TaxID=7011 RepID=UPI002118147D